VPLEIRILHFDFTTQHIAWHTLELPKFIFQNGKKNQKQS